MARRTLGWPADRPLSVFGGLTFGGGPIANYMSHAVVSMVQRLRTGGRIGFLFANGGFATDNHCIVLSREPLASAAFPQDFDYQHEADAAREPIPVLRESYEGPATVESYTVFFGRDGAATRGVVVALTPEGERTLAAVPASDTDALAYFMSGDSEPVGSLGRIARDASGTQIWGRHAS
jgi:acetyl-CoA C-acetyltransferase